MILAAEHRHPLGIGGYSGGVVVASNKGKDHDTRRYDLGNMEVPL
jgi:hypothetical protein